jgi:hypothetical protein
MQASNISRFSLTNLSTHFVYRDGIVNNPLDGTSPTCAQLANRGLNGSLSETFCALLPGVVFAECECDLPEGSTQFPTADPTVSGGGRSNFASRAALLAIAMALMVL